MSLSEAALRKLTKGEVIALFLEYQAKFDNTLFQYQQITKQTSQRFQKN